MRTSSASLPLVFRVLNRAAAPIRSSSQVFRPARFVRKVDRATGDAALLPARIHGALDVLCRSLTDDANLHLFGQQNLDDMITTGLIQRARLERHVLEAPELDEEPLVPPLIVCGLPRSGTTFLHRLLSVADDARSLPLWEALFPIARRGPDLRRFEVGLKLRLFRWATRAKLDPIHLVRTRLPDECMYLMRTDLRSSVFWVGAPAFSYLDWLLEQRLDDTYTTYRRFLQILQPSAPGRRFTLKNPSHALQLPALLRAIPNAMVVRTHRDPLQLVPSYHKLIAVSHGSISNGVDPARVVQANTRYLSTMAQRSVSFQHERVFDVDYRQLVADPIGTVSGIYDHFGLSFPERLQSRMATFVQNNRQHSRGANPYTVAQFGQTPGELRQVFADYIARYIQ